MQSHSKKRTRTRAAKAAARRQGGILVLVAFMLVVLIVAAMFSIDVAYMQTTQTELRAATDAASKAGAEALARTQDITEARKAAKQVAKRNMVAGAPLKLRNSEIIVGHAEEQSDGTWAFQAKTKPYTAIRIESRLGGSSKNNAARLFFAPVMKHADFTPSQSATSAHLEQEVVLVLDRSHSMCFDLSGVDWSYPPDVETDPDEVAYPPDPNLSRWAALRDAVNQFMVILKDTPTPPKLGLVTWASYIGTNTYEYQVTGLTSEAVTEDSLFTSDYDSISSLVLARENGPMMGGTDMSAGIDQGVDMLLNHAERIYSKKTIILMTDGNWNKGRDPLLAAQDAADLGYVIHTISFLDSASSTTTMLNIAQLTGGRHYVASDADALKTAFEDLARNIPVVLID